MGQFGEYVKMALDNIRANKGRSILTMLGIIIGISSVITIVSIGNGVKKDLDDASGSALKTVTIAANKEKTTDEEIINRDDLDALKSQLGNQIQGAYFSGYGSEKGTVETRKGKYDLSVAYVSSDYFKQSTINKVGCGEVLTEDDELGRNMVCVVTKSSALRLFGTTDVIGMDLEVTQGTVVQNVKIKGIMEEDEDSLEYELTLDSSMFQVTVYMPYTIGTYFGDDFEGFSAVSLPLTNNEYENVVQKTAIKLLDSRHANAGEKLFMKQDDMMASLFSEMSSVLTGVTAFIALVAGISLLVGGIGVMNIMLVSVTERTREIGIRKSLGAKTGSIIAQFLCESAIISGIGGILGIILGITLAKLIGMIPSLNVKPSLSVTAILVATAFSCGVGIVFGIYPARKAAKLHPIDALRQM